MRKLPQDSAFAAAKSRPHESASKHVSGEAVFLDDMPLARGELHVATAQSARAHADITRLELSEVWKSPGVVDVITYKDIPGSGDISPVFEGDLMLADDFVHYVGQPLFAVAALTFRQAKIACSRAQIEYKDRDAILLPQDALKADEFVLPTHTINCGDPQKAISEAPLHIESEFYIKGQEHFYLEGQISRAVPTEDGGVTIYSSSQHPAEVQKLAAHVLDLPLHLVHVETRRMGGGFGGKESQAAPLACTAALFAVRNSCAVRYRMPRQDDMVQTGKRHDFYNKYRVGFDASGKILGVEYDLVGKCGCTADLSDGVVDRAMFHADNAYYLENARISGYRAKTHTVSNTAFRGFGGPKGVLLAEAIIEEIACQTGQDALDVRLNNCYQPGNRTPYGQEIDDAVLYDVIKTLEVESDYRARREKIRRFNMGHTHLKKGLALCPVKFGISFTSKHLNQGAALLHIYTDGSVQVSHGGTEMGQGLYTKVAQIVARGLGVNFERVNVAATRTDKVPNASPTAASAGTDLNGMAALDAAEKITTRLKDFAVSHFGINDSEFIIENDEVRVGDKVFAFPEFIKLAYFNRISLSATGFYKTPKIGYDREKGKGRPFLYFANGAAVAEVIIDTFTGEYKVLRVDVLHDVGQSLNADIDKGQIEGAFVQGMGWLTTEELSWDEHGRVISNSPANYKIPTAADVPEEFHVHLYQKTSDDSGVYKSKAVGEPPLMLGISVWCALKDACASLSNHMHSPPLAAPATPEQVFFAAKQARDYGGNEK